MSQDTVLNSNLRELHENDNPPPVWSEQAGSVYVTFLPAILPSAQQVTLQVPDKYATNYRGSSEILKNTAPMSSS
ncbi:MAG: hypothetical protein KAI50_13775 [Desulfobacterales bacterium]|nr:hypothetical protein [Desulfobacterales bacterium]